MVKKKIMKPLKADQAHLKEEQEQERRRCKVTAQTSFEESLPYLVRKKFFLFKPRLLTSEFCYLPCWRVILNYSVSYFKKNRAEDGKIEFIVDPIKGCGANEERLNLKLVKKAIPVKLLAAEELSREQAEKKAIVDARWKVLMAKFKRPPELETASMEQFYRPYYKVQVAWGSKTETQWVAADDFANYFVYN